MYIGTDIEAKPIPAPTTTRPTSRISLVTDMPIITDPMAKMALKSSMYYRCQSPKYENGFKHLWHLVSGRAMNTNDENL